MQIIRNSPSKKKNKQRNRQQNPSTPYNNGYCPPLFVEPPRIQTPTIEKIDVCTDCVVNSKKHAEIATSPCTICLLQHEIGETITTTNCNHIFHKTCLDTWIAQNRTCPVCRMKLKFNNEQQSTKFDDENITELTYSTNWNVLRIMWEMRGLSYSD